MESRVSAEYAEAGIPRVEARELHRDGATPEFVHRCTAAGVGLEDYASMRLLARHGVDPEAWARYPRRLSTATIISLHQADISAEHTAAYLVALARHGHPNPVALANTLHTAARHRLSPEALAGLIAQVGFRTDLVDAVLDHDIPVAVASGYTNRAQAVRDWRQWLDACDGDAALAAALIARGSNKTVARKWVELGLPAGRAALAVKAGFTPARATTKLFASYDDDALAVLGALRT